MSKKNEENIELIEEIETTKSSKEEKTRVKKDEKKSSKKIFIIIGVVVGFIAIVGIILLLTNKKEEPVKEEPKKEEEQEIPKENEPQSTVDSKDVKVIDVNSKTRPYAIMINCKSEALPQAGLQDAYIVYELMVEGGITRMLAIFKDVDLKKVGSVRSARDQYLGYSFENDAIYVHAGGAQETLSRIANEKIADIDVDGKYGVRDKSLKRDWEHVLFTDSTHLEKGMKDKKLRSTTEQKNLLHYDSIELDLSQYKDKAEAKDISIKYSNYRTSIYKYDETNKYYLRSMNSKKNTDLVTGEQYHVKNIIVYGVKHDTYTAHGYYGYQKPHNIGTGEGYYITDGYALPITWEKKDEASQTIYKYKETGKELVVNDGNTYIQIYPTNGGKLTIK